MQVPSDPQLRDSAYVPRKQTPMSTEVQHPSLSRGAFTSDVVVRSLAAETLHRAPDSIHDDLDALPTSSCPRFLHQSCPETMASSIGIVSAQSCRARLGDHTYSVLRSAMVQQSELFIEQLWDLHRLTRQHGRKAALLEAALVDDTGSKVAPDAHSAILDRARQIHVHSKTMASIVELPTIPATLRRTPSETADPLHSASKRFPDAAPSQQHASARDNPLPAFGPTCQTTPTAQETSRHPCAYNGAPSSQPFPYNTSYGQLDKHVIDAQITGSHFSLHQRLGGIPHSLAYPFAATPPLQATELNAGISALNGVPANIPFIHRALPPCPSCPLSPCIQAGHTTDVFIFHSCDTLMSASAHQLHFHQRTLIIRPERGINLDEKCS
jgi:hypothetical protein